MLEFGGWEPLIRGNGMQKKLSVDLIEAAKPRSKRYLIRDTRTLGLAVKVEPTGRRSFIFEYRLHGRPSRRYLIGRFGEPWTLEAARKESGRLRALVDQGLDPVEQLHHRGEEEAPRHTVTELMQRVFTHLEKIGRRPGTLNEYRRQAAAVILPRFGSRDVDGLTAEDMERMHASMRQTPYEANRSLALIRRALNLAERWGWRKPGTNPTRFIERYKEVRRGAKKGAMLMPEQIARLFEALEAEETLTDDLFAFAALRFAFWTGWRLKSEVLRLEWANLDLTTGQARLVRTKTADEEYRILPDAALEILRGLPRIAGSRWVFPGRKPGEHRTTVRKVWDRVRRRAGLTELDELGAYRIHDLRHNAVSWDVSRGVSLKIAGANVGHKSVQATEVYSHFAPDHLRAAANARAEAMREAMTKPAAEPTDA